MTRRLTALAALAAILALATACQPEHDPYDADNFPCQEDEYLGYAPGGDDNRVYCIHIDELGELYG